jgi:hypothetical protein
MTILYCIISALITLSATFIAPHIVAHYRRYKTRKQQHLQALVREEVEQYLNELRK